MIGVWGEMERLWEACASGNSVRNTFKESRFNTPKGNPFDSKNRGS